ncbi:hypothetical protein AAC387_Pa08g1601 [Persea americana]
MKEDDLDTVMVYMTGTQRGRRSAGITARNSNPTDGGESNSAFDGRETPVTDEKTPLVGKNTGGMASIVLWVIDDDVSLITRSLESGFSPLAGPSKYPVFMATETSAPVNVE